MPVDDTSASRSREDRNDVSVSLEGVTVSLRRSVVLDRLELTVWAGSIVGISGENGAGKSTLLRTIAGLIAVDDGIVTVLGGDPRSPNVAERVGCAIDTPAAYSWMSARGHLRTVQLMVGADDRAEVARRLEQFGLADAGRKPIFRFSQGMHKRLALAQAALGSPRLLLLDEPTNALDPTGRDEVWSWLHRERSAGTTVIVASHREADRARCDATYELLDGRLRHG